MIVFPNAKINIGLNVLNKREDGYHNLESLFYPIQLKDCLEFTESNKFEFSQSGLYIDSNSDDNLVTKAYRLLKTAYNLPEIKIHLHKVIPSGAGLGGGSADAAFMIRALNSQFSLGLGEIELVDYARKLGSDCAFFIKNYTAIATGTGDVLDRFSIDFSNRYLFLIKPQCHVSTADAYRSIVPFDSGQKLDEVLTSTPISRWKGVVKNDFEKSVFAKFPEIEAIKNKLYFLGASYASMSGSGSSVFGIFDSNPEDLKLAFNDCFTWCEKLK